MSRPGAAGWGLGAALVALAFAAPARADTRLFSLLEERGRPRPSAELPIRLDLELLRSAPPALTVEVDGRELRLLRRGFERRGLESHLWHGRARGGEEVVLTTVRGRTSGVVFAAGGSWEIAPRPGRRHVLLVPEPGARRACGVGEGDGVAVSEPPLERSVSGPAARAPGPIDVLVLYDAATRDTLGSVAAVEAVIQNNVDLTNVAYRNSRVKVRLRLVHVARVGLPDSLVTHQDNLRWLRSDPEVAGLRELHGADLVGLLFDRDTGFCGTAAMVYRPGSGRAGDAVFDVVLSCGVSGLTFAHEVGHLQGGDHDPDNAGTPPSESPVPYAFGHYQDGAYRTVMSYSTNCLDGCPAQPFFSNPNVRFRRLPSGVAGERFNARILDETAGEVAAFRPAAPGCDLPAGHPDFCRDCGPCRAREGDCDGDGECRHGLVCAEDVGARFGFDEGADVCLGRRSGCTLPAGHPDRCRLCGPCGFGEGDCDRDAECQSGLVCLHEAGPDYGLSATTDVCGQRADGFCPHPVGHPDYCRACGPCRLGEGHCRDGGDCALPLISRCAPGAGARFGLPAGAGVCVPRGADCGFALGDPRYCTVCGRCDLGEGDCDEDRECRPGLVCVDGAGADFGLPAGTDACLRPDESSRLAAPVRLRGAALSPRSVRLRWDDRSQGETSFVVEMKVDALKFEGVARVGPEVTSVVLEGLRPGTAYTFRVNARSAEARSDYSNERTLRTPGAGSTP